MNNFGILFDLDGVVYQGEELIAGARESIRILRQNNIPFRFITNTTRMTKIKLVAMLQSMGLALNVNEVFAAPHAAVEYCKIEGYKKIELVVPDREMEDDFADFELHTTGKIKKKTEFETKPSDNRAISGNISEHLDSTTQITPKHITVSIIVVIGLFFILYWAGQITSEQKDVIKKETKDKNIEQPTDTIPNQPELILDKNIQNNSEKKKDI